MIAQAQKENAGKTVSIEQLRIIRRYDMSNAIFFSFSVLKYNQLAGVDFFCQ